jgi:hypothetical protein
VDRPVRVWLPHVAAPDPPGGSGLVEVIPKHPVLVGTRRRRTYKSTGGDPETMIPAVRLGLYASSPNGQGRGHR